MVKLVKGDAVKVLDDQSSLIPVLKFEGWAVEGEEKEVVKIDELDALKAEAEALGVKVHHKAGAEKIKELIAEAKK